VSSLKVGTANVLVSEEIALMLAAAPISSLIYLVFGKRVHNSNVKYHAQARHLYAPTKLYYRH
jgi:hypothetical protein